MKSLKGIDIDVPVVLDQGEIHIIGRSSSSIEDQLMFTETRRDSLRDIQGSLRTTNGVEVEDVIHFFFMEMVLQLNLKLVTKKGVDIAV